MLLEKHLVIHRIGIIGINKTSALSFSKTGIKIKILMELEEFFQIDILIYLSFQYQ